MRKLLKKMTTDEFRLFVKGYKKNITQTDGNARFEMIGMARVELGYIIETKWLENDKEEFIKWLKTVEDSALYDASCEQYIELCTEHKKILLQLAEGKNERTLHKEVMIRRKQMRERVGLVKSGDKRGVCAVEYKSFVLWTNEIIKLSSEGYMHTAIRLFKKPITLAANSKRPNEKLAAMDRAFEKEGEHFEEALEYSLGLKSITEAEAEKLRIDLYEWYRVYRYQAAYRFGLKEKDRG